MLEISQYLIKLRQNLSGLLFWTTLYMNMLRTKQPTCFIIIYKSTKTCDNKTKLL